MAVLFDKKRKIVLMLKQLSPEFVKGSEIVAPPIFFSALVPGEC
jgi:hypothetical protein